MSQSAVFVPTEGRFRVEPWAWSSNIRYMMTAIKRVWRLENGT